MAIEEGIPGIELDVHLCQSGEVVVFHDFTLKRLTRREGTVEETSYSDLALLTVDPQGKDISEDQKIPLLEEVFEMYGKKGNIYFDIEIKERGIRGNTLCDTLAAVITNSNMAERCLISSFNPFSLARFRRRAPHIPTALIFSRHKEVPLIFRRGQGRLLCGAEILKPHYPMVNPASLFFDRDIQRYQILPWTVDDPVEGEKLLRAGVYGLISNDPGKMLPIMGSGKPPG